MQDYKKLVEALRICSSDLNCGDCPLLYKDSCSSDELMSDAADAIEALNRLLDQNTQRCEALRKQLREAHESYERQLNELEAQLPKRGEWISEWDGFEFDVRCSVCGEMALIKEGGSHDHAYSRYCPNCGAKMGGTE